MISTRDALLLGLALLLPLGVLTVRKLGAAQASADLSTPPAQELPLPLVHLSGTRELEDGSIVRVSLAPWRADPGRLSTESAGIQRRLRLNPEGALLELQIERSAVREGAIPLALEVLSPRVVDGRGTCAQSLPKPADGGVVDPWLTLAAAAQGPLQPGQRARGILWGVLPGPGARVELPLPLELAQ